MKVWNVLVLLCISSTTLAQEWRDALSIARQAYQDKQYQKAYNYYQRAQRNAPEQVDFSQEIAQTAYRIGDYTLAENLYRHHIDRCQDSVDRAKSYHNLGNTLVQQHQYDQAIVAYKASIKLDPNNDKTRHNLIETRKKQQARQSLHQTTAQQQTANNGVQQQDQQQAGNVRQQNNTNNGHRPTDTSELEQKMIEKKLDELTKQELYTKQRMNQSNGRLSSLKSKNDW